MLRKYVFSDFQGLKPLKETKTVCRAYPSFVRMKRHDPRTFRVFAQPSGTERLIGDSIPRYLILFFCGTNVQRAGNEGSLLQSCLRKHLQKLSPGSQDRKSTRLNSSHSQSSY